MQRAIQLACKSLGNTYPNPLVGSVIVSQGRIIGEGWHHKAGEPHAEINAMNSVQDKEKLTTSTLYVTLEPCAHYGKTPPCAEKIIEWGIPKVVIGSMDPHEKVNGKGKALLEKAGVEVITGVLHQQCEDLNKRFFTFHRKQRPYIILKWAQSADGFMDKDLRPYKISNNLSLQKSHQLRADEHAILVGTQTVLNDNPDLTVREVKGNNPIRIILDRKLCIPSNYKVLNKEATTLIINEKEQKSEANLHWISLGFDQNLLTPLLDILYRKQIQSVIVEGGAYTLHQFIKQQLWDEAWVFTAENLHLNHGTKSPRLTHREFSIEQLRDNQLKIYKNI
ncbi:bifunctional diaminohydroxyphosphoribosylaminopyrimidine deaminase/5-amino-6-(5-phosphoribosylamino)uracil reductase RibD [Elizabethkingia argentiflava]|uniref:Riboflavin biosynthesis protein RibD n=2 Tax=Elizabethkingia argenteiflava TaxID=2681556 RepID=A0A845PTZ1_9FLAO|nr:bifunctional diaminohydroxyphosphoribosylaminopyrimidine deaminase/5-amino-6-(5-phosphoribosylamino)uracil reductase RibD [Elizabethkingia argenteiflava]